MRLRRVLGAIVVAICVGRAPIVEGFDRWDNTLQDGNDTEANLVLAAVCVGFALTLAATLGAWLRALRSEIRSSVSLTSAALTRTLPISLIPTTSPPTPLRI